MAITAAVADPPSTYAPTRLSALLDPKHVARQHPLLLTGQDLIIVNEADIVTD